MKLVGWRGYAMKNKIDFEILVENRCRAIKEVLTQKAKEYASDKSRFHNFEVAIRILDTTPGKALVGMMVKHLVSVMDLVEWAEVAPEKITEAIINEKCGDSINYLILLEGLLKLRIKKHDRSF